MQNMLASIKWAILSTIFLCVAGLLGCDLHNSQETQSSSSDGNFELYTFSTRDVTGFEELFVGESSYNAEGIGHLYMPKEADDTSKIPLMIILHGSGGTWGGRGARHAELLAQHGIGALVIDTFASRGLDQNDKYIRRLMEVNFPDQLTDAFGALDSLQTHPLIDGSRIGVMGYSLGGASTMLAAYESIAASSSNNNLRFSLHSH